MKASKEYRDWINSWRSFHARRMRSKGKHPNGGTGFLDSPKMDSLLKTSKKRNRRVKVDVDS